MAESDRTSAGGDSAGKNTEDESETLETQELGTVEERLEEEELIFRVEITDSRGRFAQDSKTIRLEFPPRDLEAPG